MKTASTPAITSAALKGTFISPLPINGLSPSFKEPKLKLKKASKTFDSTTLPIPFTNLFGMNIAIGI